MSRPVPWPPHIPLAAALVVGAHAGGPSPGLPIDLTILLAAIAGAVVSRRRRAIALAALTIAAAALGAALQRADWIEREARRGPWFPGEAPAVEAEIAGLLVASPERGLEGERTVVVATSATPGRPALVARLSLAVADPAEASRIDALREGDRVRCWVRLLAPAPRPGLSATSAAKRWAAQGHDVVGRIKSSRLLRLESVGLESWSRRVDRARVAARAALDRSLGDHGAARGVLGAMLLGDRALVDADAQVALRDSGLVHLLSISGLHTALSVLALVTLLRRGGMRAGGLTIIGLLAIVAFVAFVGQGASVLRAAGSLALALVARSVGRELQPLASLAIASAIIVIARPPLAWGLGFQLSVLATAGLLALGPLVARALPGPRLMAGAFGVSAGAYLATAPVLAQAFGRLAPVALLANLVAGVLCAFCLASGAAAAALAWVPLAGPLAATAAERSVAALYAVARAAAMIPGGHLRVAAPATLLVAVDVALLVAWSRLNSRPLGRTRGCALALVTIAMHLGPCPPGDGSSLVEVVDVGQGLAVLLRGPGGKYVLADAGPGEPGRFDAGDRIVVPRLLSEGGRRLEVIAMSHAHADHIGGVRATIEALDVGELWLPAGAEHDRSIRALVDRAVELGIAVRRLRRGDHLRCAGLAFEVVHPDDEDRARPINDRCLVLRVATDEGPVVLLPGDVESGGERSILSTGGDVTADALVAAHHGANGSNSAPFLRAVRPSVAIVSSGATNRFGHPGAEALRRLVSAGAHVVRTDRGGTISLEASPHGWRVSEEHEREGNERRDEDDGE